MHCFWTYLKNNLGAAVYLLLCCIICTAVFLLCRLSLAPVLYALGLCLFLGAFFLTAGYCRFRNRHRLLEGLLAEITASVEQLLSNALKYTPGGTVTIMAEGESTLIIADTGIGIAPDDLPRIFEEGYTGLNGRGQQRSTGIGLYLCSRILKRLGHTISISSALGQGTEVRLELGGNPLEFD